MRLRGASLRLSLVGLLCGESLTCICGAVSDDTAPAAAGLRHTETVSVQASPDTTGPGSAGQFTLSGNDLENLATVLADDPLRAVQSVPGVSSNDDFEARFSVRGAGFSRIGVYLDGIRLHNAVHSLEGTDLSGSSSILNPALIQQVDLYDGPHSERFGDTSAGVLDVRMRDGTRDRYSFQSIVNLGTAGFAANGPLAGPGRCTWIAGVRKSYLQYILSQTLSDPSMAFGIEDGEGRLSCHASPGNTIALDVIDSYTNLDRSSLRKTLGANALMKASQHFVMENLSWTYTPSDKLLIANSVAVMRDGFDAQNPIYAPLGRGSYGESAWNSEATWIWNSSNTFTAGFNSRRMRDEGFGQQYETVRRIELLDRYDGSGMLAGGYLQNSWSGWKGRLHATAGGRWDHHSIDHVSAFSPQISLTVGLLPSLELQLAWGQYAQFPEVSVFTSNLGASNLLPLRSTQATVALQQTIGTNMRIRLEFYDRQDRDLVYRPYADPRIVDGKVFLPPLAPSYANSLRGYGRGAEVYLQRTIAKGLTGWVSLSYGSTRMHDGVTGISFPSDSDQRYTSNAYMNYRIRPSVTLSARWTYGSGFPAPGFFAVKGAPSSEDFYLSPNRNQVRIGPYQRLDFRINKEWIHGKWKKTLYAEVMNVTNKANYRFGSLDGYRPGDGAAYVTVDQMFPILPSVGVVLQK